MIRICLIFGAVIIAGLSAQPAIAGKKDDAWAACLWQMVPTTANKWLNTAPVKGRFMEADNLDANLQLRLQAACKEALTPEGKDKPPSFKPKKVRAALEAQRPSVVGPDTFEPETFHCVAREGDVVLGMSAGFGKATEIESSNPKVSLDCKTVSSDGTLVVPDQAEDQEDA
ncbi:MAG: hypothetical protein AAF127_02370 [Pseudomonadota bacterium]